jgi:hypothetical protein
MGTVADRWAPVGRCGPLASPDAGPEEPPRDPIANQPDCGKAKLDRSARTVTLTVAADCLGDPDWVRVGNGIFFYDATHAYVDDARRDGVVRGDFKYGPKVTAGQ